jgi:hypothetical protein
METSDRRLNNRIFLETENENAVRFFYERLGPCRFIERRDLDHS